MEGLNRQRKYFQRIYEYVEKGSDFMEKCRFHASILMEKCVTWSLIRWKKCDEFDLFAGKSVKL